MPAGDLTITVDSRLTPAARMSMVTEDLPPGAESWFIYMSAKTRSSSFEPDVELRLWAIGRCRSARGQQSTHLRVSGTGFETRATARGHERHLLTTGFEQAFRDSLRPNRTPAEVEANRKKHGIVYRDR